MTTTSHKWTKSTDVVRKEFDKNLKNDFRTNKRFKFGYGN